MYINGRWSDDRWIDGRWWSEGEGDGDGDVGLCGVHDNNKQHNCQVLKDTFSVGNIKRGFYSRFVIDSFYS